MTQQSSSFSLQKQTTRKILGLSVGLVCAVAVVSSINFLAIYGLSRINTLQVVLASIHQQLKTNPVAGHRQALHDLAEELPLQGLIFIRVWEDGKADSPLIATGIAQHNWNQLPAWFRTKQPAMDQLLIGDREMTFNGIECEWVWSRRTHHNTVFNVLALHSDREARVQAGWIMVRFAILTVVVLFIAGLISMYLVRKIMRPINAIGQHCAAIEGGRLNLLDPTTTATPSELEPFVHTLNHMLTRLDQAMRRQHQFAADASHELRTPLAIAKSSLQLASSKPRSAAEYQITIHEALENLLRLEHLCGQLIDLARLDHDNDVRQFKHLDLRNILTEAVQLTRVDPSLDQPDIRFDPGVDAVMVLGNHAQLCRLFQNLLENAAKYGPEDQPITLTFTCTDTTVTVAVTDQGAPISPEVLSRLFDRFFRADSSRARASGGSGLGLAIAREIAQLHAASLSLSSDATTGTTATFIMPLAR